MAGRTAVRGNLTMSSRGRWAITTVRQQFRIDFHNGMVELADFEGRYFPLIDDMRFRIRCISVLELGSPAAFTMTIPHEGGSGMQHTFTTDPVTSIVSAAKAGKDGRVHVNLGDVYRYSCTNSAQSMEHRLSVDSEQLASMVVDLQVLQLTTLNGAVLYPPFQITETNRPLPGLHHVLSELADGTDDPWTWWLWLTSQPDWADKRPVWELLRDGHQDPVIRAAGRAACMWRQ